MTPRAMAWIGCWLALCVTAFGQEPAPDGTASEPATEQAAKLQERDELAARAQGLQGEGKLAEAIEVAEQVLAIEREVFGDEHAEIAGTYGWIGDMQEAAEDFPAAEKSRQAALHLLTKLHGAADWRVTDARLALEHTRLLARLDGTEREELSRSEALNQRAFELWSAGNSGEALPSVQEALEIRKQVLGEGHPAYAVSLNNLALLYLAMGEYAQAEPLHRQALEIQRKVLGEEHPEYANSLHNLALLHDEMGDYALAERLYLQALEIKKKLLGEMVPEFASSLSNLAALYHAMRDYARAEPLYRRAMEIQRTVLGEGHPDYARNLNNLAELYRSMGDYPKAEPLYLQAMEIQRKVPGEELTGYAASLNNLALLYHSKRDYARAEPLYLQAIERQKEVLGEKHPSYAASLNNLALLYHSMRDYGRAEPLYRQVLEIKRQALGEEHPDYVLSLTNLAWLHYSTGDHMSSLAWFRDAAAGYEAARLRVAAQSLGRAAFGVERSPYQFLAAVEAGHGSPVEAWRALEADLARGLLDEAASRAGLQLTADEEQERKGLIAHLGTLQPSILRLVTQSDQEEEAQAELAGLLEERSAGETRLARLAAAISERQVAELHEVQASLPADAAFVTWVDDSSRDGSVHEHWGCLLRDTGEPAWVRLPGAGPDGAWTDQDQDLPRRLRDALAQAAAEEEAAELSRQLAAQRIAPLLPHLEGVERLYVAAVNQMAGVPVDALTDRFTISYTPSGTQLARLRERERPTGEAALLALGDAIFARPGDDAVPPAIPAPLPPGGLLITQVVPESNAAAAGIESGDVLLSYAGTELTDVEQLGELIAAHAEDESVTVTIWRETEDQPAEHQAGSGRLGVALAREPAAEAIARRRAGDLLLAGITRGKKWHELPGTRVEIAALAELFPSDRVTLLADADASEQRLAALRESGELGKYRYLHLATHGQVNRASAFESALILSQTDLSTVDDVAAGEPFYDGRLTANEILTDWKLNAELVTLSSCESGLGRAGGGEGFLGFAQALLLAGSRSICLSLWEVEDTATALLMDRFYQNLLGQRDGLAAPLPKAEALAEAKRWLRSLTVDEAAALAADLSHGVARGAGHETTVVDLVPPSASEPDAHPYEHPYFWAAFVLIGDPE